MKGAARVRNNKRLEAWTEAGFLFFERGEVETGDIDGDNSEEDAN
jgi:hypothetical protein